ncbi:MAG: hypothetical protein ACRD47_15280, partial [Nitrososphaeraceae archaeon]
MSSSIQRQILKKPRPPEYLKVLEDIDKAHLPVVRFANTSKTYIPLLYRILIKNGYEPQMARLYIVNDCCPHYWVEVTVLKLLPRETKHSG